MKEILFSFYRTKLIDISLLNNYISSNAIGSKIASSLQLNSESVLIGLMGGAILKFGLKKMPLPYTVGLFAFGLLIGTFDRIGWLESIPILKSSIDFAGNANPDMILYIFLPILIFDAAYELDVHIFRKTLTNATILSVPGVIIAMLLTAALMIGIGTFAPSYEGWNWTFALMFGALISATDPVAVVALLKELGTSKRFSTLVDAESMLNDGTGIVLFMLFFGAYTATGVSDSPVADFIIVSIVHYSYKNHTIKQSQPREILWHNLISEFYYRLKIVPSLLPHQSHY